MKVTRVTTVEREVTRCYHECPYFSTEGMEHAMVCEHPQAPGDPPYKGFGVISHPDCITGFPKECPLKNPATLAG